MPCTRARSSHTRQRTSSYDEPSAARRPRRGRAHSSAPRGRRAPSLQSTLFIAAPQGHSGRNHSVWGTRAATRHRKRHPPSCVVDPPRASFRPALCRPICDPGSSTAHPPEPDPTTSDLDPVRISPPSQTSPSRRVLWWVGGTGRLPPRTTPANDRTPIPNTSTHFNFIRA